MTARLAATAALFALALGACSRDTSHTLSGTTTDSPPNDGSAAGGTGDGGSPPGPPASFAVNLTWDDPTTGPTPSGYNAYRGSQTGGPYTEIGSVNGATAAAYTDSAVSDGTTYYYVVTSFIASPYAESVYSNEAAVTVPTSN